MPNITAPYVETQQVVTGFMYQLHIAESDNGTGIQRIDIGPYRFPGVPPQMKYPEAVTNEMCPPGWQPIHWVTDENGDSWLRWEGRPLKDTEGEVIFQFTSNYTPSNTGASLHVWRDGIRVPERYSIAAPDYSIPPPEINPRHDVVGKGNIFTKGAGCAPMTLAITAFAFYILNKLIT